MIFFKTKLLITKILRQIKEQMKEKERLIKLSEKNYIDINKHEEIKYIGKQKSLNHRY